MMMRDGTTTTQHCLNQCHEKQSQLVPTMKTDGPMTTHLKLSKRVLRRARRLMRIISQRITHSRSLRAIKSHKVRCHSQVSRAQTNQSSSQSLVTQSQALLETLRVEVTTTTDAHEDEAEVAAVAEDVAEAVAGITTENRCTSMFRTTWTLGLNTHEMAIDHTAMEIVRLNPTISTMTMSHRGHSESLITSAILIKCHKEAVVEVEDVAEVVVEGVDVVDDTATMMIDHLDTTKTTTKSENAHKMKILMIRLSRLKRSPNQSK